MKNYHLRFKMETIINGKVMILLKNIHFSGKKAQLYVTAFFSSYQIESRFSCVSNLQLKACNQLDIIRSELRLSLAMLKPNITKLAE